MYRAGCTREPWARVSSERCVQRGGYQLWGQLALDLVSYGRRATALKAGWQAADHRGTLAGRGGLSRREKATDAACASVSFSTKFDSTHARERAVVLLYTFQQSTATSAESEQTRDLSITFLYTKVTTIY